MGKTVVKFYGDGEFWIDGQKRAKLYSDGDIWADGKKIGQLYEDGDIWINGRKVGSCTEDGDIWIDGKRVATGVHLLSVFDQKESSSSSSSYTSSYSSSGGSPTRSQVGEILESAVNGSLFLGSFVVLVICTILASFLVWTRGIPDIFATNFNNYGIAKAALIFTYTGMLFMLYKHWDIATREGEPMFCIGLLLQGLACLFNILVFYLLDIFITAFSYGFTLFEILGQFGSLFAGFLGAAIGVVLFFGLAPALVGTVFNFFYLHIKGRRYKTSSSKSAFKGMFGSLKKRTAKKTYSSKSTFGSSKTYSSPTKTRTYGSSSTAGTYTKKTTSTSSYSSGSTTRSSYTSSPTRSSSTSSTSSTSSASKSGNSANTKIHMCVCGRKLYVSTDRGEHTFTCPHCQRHYAYKPSK